jgi:molecular chaperone GrpE (heat shock protein)
MAASSDQTPSLTATTPGASTEEPLANKTLLESVVAPPSTQVAAARSDLGEITAIITDLVKQQRKFYDMVEERFRVDSARDDLIDKLHRELQEHRSDLLGRIVLPILRDVIRLREQLVKFVGARRDYDTDRRDWDNLLDNVLSFGDDMVEILERHGLTAFQEEEARFNPRSQRAVRVVPTDEETQDRMIAERIQAGLRWGSQLISHEQVAIYKLMPRTVDATASSTG